jgi:hypothetical protein
MRGTASLEAAPLDPLKRDTDRNSRGGGIPAVVQVVAVVGIIDIDVVSVVPVIRPVFRPWVNGTDPVALVLKAGISTHDQERAALDSEPMVRSKVSTEPVLRDAVAAVAATLLPGAMV